MGDAFSHSLMQNTNENTCAVPETNSFRSQPKHSNPIVFNKQKSGCDKSLILESSLSLTKGETETGHLVQNQNTAMKSRRSQTQELMHHLWQYVLADSCQKFSLKLERLTVKGIVTNSLGSSCYKRRAERKCGWFYLTHVHLTSIVHFCLVSQSTIPAQAEITFLG